MIEKIFYNIIISGSIISFCMFPLLFFLNNNKYKYNFRSLYKIFIFIILLLFIPINTINFSGIKNLVNKKEYVQQKINIEEPKLKFETENIVVEFDKEIYVKNDIFFNISSMIPYIWLTITSILLLYNLSTYVIFFNKQKRNWILAENKKIYNCLEKIKNNINLKKDIQIFISQNTSTPMTVGVFQKKIILPKEVFDNDEYEMILKHELFHIKYKDIELKILLLLLDCIYWFNPIIYMLTNQFDEILELRCDESVLENKNQEYRTRYAKTLLNQIEKNVAKRYSFSMNFANRRKNIMKRFSNIIDTNKKKNIVTISSVTAVLIIVSVLLIVLIPNINFASIENKETKLNNIETNTITNTTTSENKSEIIEDKKYEIEYEKTNSIDNNKTEENKVENNSHNDEEVTTKDIISESEEVSTVETNKIVTDQNEEVSTVETNKIEADQNEDTNIEENNINQNKKIITIQTTLPINKESYEIRKRFGPVLNGVHTGIDLIAKNGTPIVSVMDGTVIFSGYKGSYGNLVIVENEKNKTQTYYAHCSELNVEVGDKVNVGDKIASVGSTGNSTEPHLHFEVRDESKNAINPEKYFSF